MHFPKRPDISLVGSQGSHLGFEDHTRYRISYIPHTIYSISCICIYIYIHIHSIYHTSAPDFWETPAAQIARVFLALVWAPNLDPNIYQLCSKQGSIEPTPPESKGPTTRAQRKTQSSKYLPNMRSPVKGTQEARILYIIHTYIHI